MNEKCNVNFLLSLKCFQQFLLSLPPSPYKVYINPYLKYFDRCFLQNVTNLHINKYKIKSATSAMSYFLWETVWYILFNLDSLHAKLDSHYKAWSYKKKKCNKIKAYAWCSHTFELPNLWPFSPAWANTAIAPPSPSPHCSSIHKPPRRSWYIAFEKFRIVRVLTNAQIYNTAFTINIL